MNDEDDLVECEDCGSTLYASDAAVVDDDLGPVLCEECDRQRRLDGPCSATTTILRPGGGWSGLTLLDPDMWGCGDWGCTPAAQEILDGALLSLLDRAMASQTRCARYYPSTSEIYLCVAHARVFDPSEAMREFTERFDELYSEWINGGGGLIAEAWRSIDALCSEATDDLDEGG